jgi:hypothetical protein
VDGLPDGTTLQNAATAYVDAAQFWAPDLAAERALRLGPGVREEKLVQCCRRWMQLDPRGARAWLDGRKLAEDVKQRCLTTAPVTP